MSTAIRRPYDPTREQKARADLSVHPDLRVLSEATPEALIDAVIRLTHQTHDATRVRDAVRLADLRAQRDLCRAELLSRVGA